MGKTKKKGANKARWILLVLAIVIAIGAYFVLRVFGPNTGSFSEGDYLYIRTGSTYDDVKRALVEGNFVRNINSFDMVAKRADYPAKVKAGKYKINRGMNNYNMVRMLRNGRQEPVKLVINKLRTKQDFVNLVSSKLEADSLVMKQILADPVYLAQFGLDTNTAMSAILPDTYEFFWNTNADNTFRKIAKYYKAYWTEERKQKAQLRGLTPSEAVILASIVDEETNKNDEKGNVASVYLNRMKAGMRLQADPTVRFAVGDFGIRRINKDHLQTPSPYNTYLNKGLPPGPICTPSKKSIEAVINSPDTKFIYFCAKEDFSGYHRFADNYKEHQKNARVYQQALDARNIHSYDTNEVR